jgi:DNA-binding NarL/FixJ family response regulator
MPALRIMLVDDHALVRAGMKALLASFPDLEVVGETDDGAAAVELAGKLHPNVVLMDIAMHGLNGLDATARIRNHYPDVRVIILSMHANEEYVFQALRAGASGYLLKDSATSELEFAVRAVSRGETYLSPPISKAVVDGYVQRMMTEQPLDLLTPRQREILQLVAEGGSTKEIAHRLGLSVKTIEAHRSQIMERLGIHDIPGLVRFAVRAGLISADR